MTFVVAAPYVRFRRRFEIGPWEFIPHEELVLGDTLSQGDLDRAKGLMALYHRSRRVRHDFGCYVRRRGSGVGDLVSFSQLGTLRTVALFGFLDQNPVGPELGGDDDPNAGHRIWTSDNLSIVGHNVDVDGYVAARYGAMSQNLIGGLRLNDPHSEIAPPAELVCPFMGQDPDPVVTDALWVVLRRSTADARRIGRAIDWLDLAWRNTPSVSQEMRAVLLKTGFETLLDVGERVENQRAALQGLLPRVKPRSRMRHVPNRAGQLRSERMTDLEWWYTKFAFLRNAITHGDLITAGMHRFGRTYHLWIAELRLRQAVKQCVAQQGFPLVPMSPWDRATVQAVTDLEQALRPIR